MLFTGFSEHTIDAKGRLSIPAKYRSAWTPERDGNAWICVPWPGETPSGRALHLYTELGFEHLAASQWAPKLIEDPDQAELKRAFFSFAERLETDAQGRLKITPRHLQLTGLTGPVVLVGAQTHLEVLSQDAWLEQETARFEQLPRLAARARNAPN